MGKKRQREADKAADVPPKPRKNDDNDDNDDDDDSSDDDFDIVNVDFEWFNFDPEVDFHSLRTLLRQLLDVDASLFDISALADLILSQPTIGSTVKVDGKANDAYAFITILNTRTHAEHAAMAQLISYLTEKAAGNAALAAVIPKLLRGNDAAHVGLVLGERLVNMPGEIAPPMYAMLADEVEAAVEDKEPYEFSHYLVLSKTYLELRSALDDETAEGRRNKKAKGDAPMSYFHVEDEVLEKHSLAYGGFPYTKENENVADSKRAFQEMGVQSQGYMMLIEASKFEGAVKAMTEYLPPPK